jgi:hypothetical protein
MLQNFTRLAGAGSPAHVHTARVNQQICTGGSHQLKQSSDIHLSPALDRVAMAKSFSGKRSLGATKHAQINASMSAATCGYCVSGFDEVPLSPLRGNDS